MAVKFHSHSSFFHLTNRNTRLSNGKLLLLSFFGFADVFILGGRRWKNKVFPRLFACLVATWIEFQSMKLCRLVQNGLLIFLSHCNFFGKCQRFHGKTLAVALCGGISQREFANASRAHSYSLYLVSRAEHIFYGFAIFMLILSFSLLSLCFLSAVSRCIKLLECALAEQLYQCRL